MKKNNSDGIIIRIQGPVVDIYFENDLPSIHEALEVNLGSNKKLIPIGNKGWCNKYGKRALYDQQPVDVGSIVQTYLVAHKITKKNIYYSNAVLAFNWFLGKNSLNLMVYDEATGGCFDGLSETGINLNQGAESTVSYLLARLNLDFIPIDIDFTLNKYGSYNAELADLNENKYFKVEPYILKTGVNSKKFILKPEGKAFFLNSVKPKLDKILTKEDFEILQNKIRELSDMRADEISDNEHKKLLVDTEDRFKLEQKVNVVYCDMHDLYEISKSLPENTLVDISLKALIEYCYHLIKFIKEIRFKHIPEGYDYEGYMFDYYFINQTKDFSHLYMLKTTEKSIFALIENNIPDKVDVIKIAMILIVINNDPDIITEIQMLLYATLATKK